MCGRITCTFVLQQKLLVSPIQPSTVPEAQNIPEMFVGWTHSHSFSGLVTSILRIASCHTVPDPTYSRAWPRLLRPVQSQCGPVLFPDKASASVSGNLISRRPVMPRETTQPTKLSKSCGLGSVGK